LPKKTKRKAKRRKSNPKRNPKKNHKESIWKKITVLASSVAGLDNIAGSAMKDSTGQPIGERAKNFINALVGKTTGFNPIPNTPYNYHQQISVEGMFNKYAGIGAAAWLYSILPIKKLPYKSKAGSFGKKMAAVGAITGIFKTPEGSHGSHNRRIVTSPMIANTNEVSYR